MVTIVKSGYATGYWWAWGCIERDYATGDEVEAMMNDDSTSPPTDDFREGVEAALNEVFGDIQNNDRPPKRKVLANVLGHRIESSE